MGWHHGDFFCRFLQTFAILLVSILAVSGQEAKNPQKVQTPPPTHPPLESVDMSALPSGTEQLDVFLHPELFLSVAPGGSGYEPEKRIQGNDVMLHHQKSFDAHRPLAQQE